MYDSRDSLNQMKNKTLFIRALEVRLNKLRLECSNHIADSKALLATMFAQEIGLELGQVVIFSSDLYTILELQLDETDPSGLQLTLGDYYNPSQLVYGVSPAKVRP